MAREFASRTDSITGLRASEAILRYSFERDARLTNPEKGYVSVPWVNQLVDINLQGYAADIIAAKVHKNSWDINKIVGIPNLGIPLATSVSERLELPLAPGRKGDGIPGSW